MGFKLRNKAADDICYDVLSFKGRSRSKNTSTETKTGVSYYFGVVFVFILMDADRQYHMTVELDNREQFLRQILMEDFFCQATILPQQSKIKEESKKRKTVVCEISQNTMQLEETL